MRPVPLDSVDGSGGRIVYKMVGDVRELVAATLSLLIIWKIQWWGN